MTERKNTFTFEGTVVEVMAEKTMGASKQPKRSTRAQRSARSTSAHGSAAGVESEVCKECFGSGVGQYSPLLLIGVTCKTCYGTGRMDKRQPQPNAPVVGRERSERTHQQEVRQ